MPFFQVPPPTRLDLNFSVAGIQVRIHPAFWLIAILLGSSSANLFNILMWIVVVFISILVHELGHAFAFRRFGQDSYIILHFAGGLTVPISNSLDNNYYGQARLTPNQNIFISLAGPFAGFLLALVILLFGILLGGTPIVSVLLGFIPIPSVVLPYQYGSLDRVFVAFVFINVFWGIINLMPVYPLDGGNVARYTLIQTDPLNGLRNSLWISVIVGAGLAVAGFIYLQSIFMAFMFGYLAFQSYQALQYRY
jgi:stage IV sporulation protein FB